MRKKSLLGILIVLLMLFVFTSCDEVESLVDTVVSSGSNTAELILLAEDILDLTDDYYDYAYGIAYNSEKYGYHEEEVYTYSEDDIDSDDDTDSEMLSATYNELIWIPGTDGDTESYSQDTDTLIYEYSETQYYDSEDEDIDTYKTYSNKYYGTISVYGDTVTGNWDGTWYAYGYDDFYADSDYDGIYDSDTYYRLGSITVDVTAEIDGETHTLSLTREYKRTYTRSYSSGISSTYKYTSATLVVDGVEVDESTYLLYLNS